MGQRVGRAGPVQKPLGAAGAGGAGGVLPGAGALGVGVLGSPIVLGAEGAGVGAE